ncbi:MAG: hypothetical protein K8R53_13625 [Bacteroidales bacterium]|nr:hypothetical protein [Bacteroidales bacterium]
MKKTSLQILGVILIPVFVLATGGFSIFYHYCNHEEILITSIVFQKADCDYHHYESEPEQCCEGHACSTGHQQETDNTSNCCLNNQLYFKTDQFTNFKNHKSLLPESDTFVFHVDLIKEEVGNEKISFQISYSNDIPPPLHGKDLVIYIQQSRSGDLLA